MRLKILSAGVRAAMMGILPFGESELAGAPSLDELKSFAVVRPDAVEAVRQPLYDRLVYPAAGQTQLRFFQLPQGQGFSSAIGNGGNSKTIEDTNMEAAGQLPSPKAFLATSIEVVAEPGSVSTANQWSPSVIAAVPTGSLGSIGVLGGVAGVNDTHILLQSGSLDFFIISKSYLQNARLDSFPPKSYPCFDASVSLDGTIATVSLALMRAVGRPFYLNPPVLLMPNTNFVVSLNWATQVALPSGFNARIMTRLDGFMYRNAQ